MIPRRVSIFAFIFIVAFGLIGWRLFYISVTRHDYFGAARKTRAEYLKQFGKRGDIYFNDYARNKLVLAASAAQRYSLELVTNQVEHLDGVLNLLSAVLPLDVEHTVRAYLDGQERIPLLDDVSGEQITKVQELNLAGVKLIAQPSRLYPQRTLAAHVLGFWGFRGHDRIGQYGIEGAYEQVLAPQAGVGSLFQKKSFAQGSELGSSQGGNLVLTIDPNVQTFVEEQITALQGRWQAPGVSAIVQDTQTGAILAMAATPSFDPGRYNHSRVENFINPTVQIAFEPGSSFKTITMASAIDAGVLTPESTYLDSGSVRIGGFTIRNFNQKSFGTQSMTQVLEKSLNTGAIFVQRKLGESNFLNYVEKFGFGKKTGIDLFSEASGDVRNLYSRRPVNFATASFGQGIAVTSIQLINAYSAIANGGRLMRPYVVARIQYPDGSQDITQPEVLGRPITEQTSQILKNMLVSVVEHGFDKAKIERYDVAGKTGTAQIPDPSGGYLEEFIHDFVGFAPAYQPRFTVLLKLDQPKGIRFSSDSLPPVFSKIMTFLLHYYGVPPN